jgi:hypothetical protein
MADRDLRLNSLTRYSKQSPTFVLEEHSHCEVPAGCGGVVLRWRNPFRAIPISLWLASNGRVHLYLDGGAPVSARPTVAPGSHVLAFRASEFDNRSGILMCAAIFDEEDKEVNHTKVSRRTGVTVRIPSAADGSWKYSTTEPTDDSWMLPSFDDANWPAMVARDLPERGEEVAPGRRRI